MSNLCRNLKDMVPLQCGSKQPCSRLAENKRFAEANGEVRLLGFNVPPLGEWTAILIGFTM